MCSMYMNFNQKQTQNLKQLQRLMMSPQMQQAIHLMQMPQLELSTVIEGELEQNPVLEYDERSPEEDNEPEEQVESSEEKELDFNDDDFEIMKRLDEDFRDHFRESENYYTTRSSEDEKLRSFLEQSICAEDSLYEHLLAQAKETFEADEEVAAAEVIIGSLNESGYLDTSLEELALLNNLNHHTLEKVLKSIQTFDPHGVGARNLRECLLIQLGCRKETHTLAYRIIDKHFDDLIHNRIPQIKKGLRCSFEQAHEAIHQKISHLAIHPGTTYSPRVVQHIVPDASVFLEEDKLTVVINSDWLPTLRLNTRYLKMVSDESLPKETRDYIRNKLMSAKWLLKNIDQRNETIYRVIESLTRHQKDFFVNPTGKIIPLTMKVVADELELHESTVARAVSNKYVDSPRGLLPLKYFFSNAYTTAEGDEISSKTVRDVLKRMIDQEDKKRPLSDEALSKLLEKKGIPCARRTVSKYRNELAIGNTNQRREY